MKKQKIGFVGLGQMGKYMALNLLKNNYQVIGFNRSKNVLEELKELGLKIALNPKEVAKQSDVVILMLPSHKETNQVVFNQNGLIEGLKKGQIVIDMSTSNPIETKKIFSKLKRRGLIMLDAPVSRGQGAAVDGTLSIMVGGDKKSFQKCLPIFNSMGKYINYLGPFGSGMYVKALNNFLYAMNLLASTQGLVIIKKNRINLKNAIKVITESYGNNEAIGSSIRKRVGQKNPKINFYLKYVAKDMGIFNEVVKEGKANNILIKPVLNYYKKMTKKYGNEDAMYIYQRSVVESKN